MWNLVIPLDQEGQQNDHSRNAVLQQLQDDHGDESQEPFRKDGLAKLESLQNRFA